MGRNIEGEKIGRGGGINRVRARDWDRGAILIYIGAIIDRERGDIDRDER